MVRKNIKYILPIIILTAFLFSSFAGAGGLFNPNTDPDAITFGDIEFFINFLASWLIRIGGIILVIYIIITGIIYMAGGSNPEKAKEANERFKKVFFGGLIIFGVGVIVATIDYLTTIPRFGP